MIAMSLGEVAAAVGGRLIGPGRAQRVTGVTTDSREVKPGDLFVALKGAAQDGHVFVADAFARGAAAALVHRTVPRVPGSLVRVRHTGKGLLALAGHYRHRLPATVIGITGSVGKTTTKELIYHALGGADGVCRSLRSLNNHVGLPLSILSAGLEHRALVLEIGGSGPGEIGRLAAVAQPRIAVMTVIGEAHLRGFGDLAGVARGKAELLTALPRDGVAFLNGDDPVLRAIGRLHRGDVRLYGTGPFSHLRAESVERTADGVIVHILGERFEVPGLAPAHANNVIAAIGVAHEMRVPLAAVARRLRHFVPAEHRLLREHVGSIVLFDDGYNANPISVRAALGELGAVAGRRRVAVLGEMLDLGSHTQRCHTEIGEALATAGVDVALGVGPTTRFTLAASRATVQAHFESTEAAIEALPSVLRPGDAVLVKASRAWRFERVVEAIRRWASRSGLHVAARPTETPLPVAVPA